MRRALDALYDGAAWLAALFMIGLLGMVLLSIVSRQLHFHVPGTDAYAGYLMAAAGFLALLPVVADHGTAPDVTELFRRLVARHPEVAEGYYVLGSAALRSENFGLATSSARRATEIALTRIDMMTLQENMPYPIVVPNFPVLTTNHPLDYGRKMR
mgnify:CR=1 FL=1